MVKTLIYNLPPLDQTKPPLSGAILSSICAKIGHKVTARDLQLTLTDFLNKNSIPTDYFNDVFHETKSPLSDLQTKILIEFINQELLDCNPGDADYVLVSFFSYLSQRFGMLFLPELRKKTQAKIIIGGAGLEANNKFSFGEKLKNSQIINEYIVGEAEEILPIYFQQLPGPGIGNNKFKQIDDLDTQVFPNFSYYDLSKYRDIDNIITLPMIGSRGCVRKCTFCDVAKSSPKYRYRSGNNIAQEIIQHYENYGVTHFYFADSLVNGSYRAFNDMCDSLVKYNFKDPISWSGQYIIRSKETTPKNHFNLLKQSGCSTLFVGIESGADRVRQEMGKKFTNDDIEFYLENFYQHGIKTLFLFFTGYITETEEDHKETLTMFRRWQKYVATGTIEGIETLNLLNILAGTPLDAISKEHNFLFLVDDQDVIDRTGWINPAQPNFDFNARVLRHIEVWEEAIKYHWPLWNGVEAATIYEQVLSKRKLVKKKYIPINSIMH